MTDDELFDDLGRAFEVPVPPVDAARVASLRASVDRLRAEREPGRAGPIAPGSAMSTRRALLWTSAAAAVGAVGGVVVTNVVRDDPAPAAGPPTESLSFSVPEGRPAATVDGKVINHTWGVELLLDTTGLAVGTNFEVTYLDVDGGEVPAGGFVGAELPIHCRCNAPLLRERIAAIEIRAAGDVVSRAEFT